VNLIDTRIGRIEGARDGIKPDFAGNLLLELAPQCSGLDDPELFARQGNPIV
jgi:hypothetical protein